QLTFSPRPAFAAYTSPEAMCTITAAKVRISGFSLKSYLSSGKSLAIVRMRWLTEAKWPRTDCAVVRGAVWLNAGREVTIRRTERGMTCFAVDTEASSGMDALLWKRLCGLFPQNDRD